MKGYKEKVEVVMPGHSNLKSRVLFLLAGGLFLLAVLLPLTAMAGDDVQTLRLQLEQMTDQMKGIQEKLEKMEAESAEEKAEIKEMDERLNKTELHTATDKISFGVEFRTRADTIHYQNIRVTPAAFSSALMNPWPTGLNGATLAQAQALMAGMNAAGMNLPSETVNADNDLILTNKFRLNMKAKVSEELSFAGRLSAYKVFGDSTGLKYNGGSLGDVTFDGNTASLPHGDIIHLERAYFNYKFKTGTLPTNLSLGRRPATDGPPLEYSNYSLEGGSPLATIINWQFDGASLNFGLEDATSIPGAAFKLCYGMGFESDWGNAASLNSPQPDVNDVNMFGVIATMFDNDETSAVFNYAHASDITDGFTGLTVMPFIVSKDSSTGTYSFAPNNGLYVSRVEPSTNIGDWDAASLLLRTNLAERFSDIDLFLATSWSHTDPSQISKNPWFELQGQGLLSSNGDLQSRDGYSIYGGAVFPMPFNARLGVEYNWGSEYWFNFTGAEDSLVGSKLATRGQVVEGYWIQPVVADKFFVTLGGRYYDYEYSGSGNPMGAPVKIDELRYMDTINSVIDTVWNAYLSATLRF